MEKVNTKSDVQRRKAENADRYKPKKPQELLNSVYLKPTPVQDPKIRTIVVETLDALKMPGAIPSVIINNALLKAMALR